MQVKATGKPRNEALRISYINVGQSSFMINNFSNCTILNNLILVNEDKSYGIKPQRFEKVAVKPIYFAVVTIQSRHQPL